VLFQAKTFCFEGGDARIAVLIDAENAQVLKAQVFKGLLDEICKYGTPVVKRCVAILWRELTKRLVSFKRAIYPCIGPLLHCVGKGIPLGCSTPHPLASRERWLRYHLWGVRVSGRDEVRTFSVWWGVKMYKMLSQIADWH
jgi:hypothetical protein